MKALRVLGWFVAAFVVLALGVVGAGRMHDGPMGMLAGGPLRTGEWATDPVPDLRFVHDLPTVEFQLLSPARSRTTWIIEQDGRVYIASGYMNSTIGHLWKQWPHEAETDGRAVLRAGGKRYGRQLVRIKDGPEVASLLAELNRKYHMNATSETLASNDLWLFELQPRTPSRDEMEN